jgi:hypothetical protein
MASLEFLQDPRNHITRAVLVRLLNTFGIDVPPPALKGAMQVALQDIPLVDLQEEVLP